ncbi:hypothetical protein M2650_10105 [Luteimonas sp. SX5]|uniref:DUF4402 domain-containing protein n=1 Tax=Luteimonas galliterrae TaxID=2940486 RepID=A0ABT0MJE9_9GAMM|nr:hypothetical protein [Luteimonas galliterrae]MCL1634980.1 hypothetical protein [Luteimonas galliterrae]
MSLSARGLRGLLLLFALCACNAAHAFVVTIDPGPRAVYLRVGNGAFSNTNYTGGGTPQTGGAINLVSLVVPAAVLGNGTDLAMTTNASSGVSNYDGYAFCDVPAEIYIGGFYRRAAFSGSGTATLTASVPANLTNASGDTIPFSQISWTSSGNGDGTTAQPVPAGSFSSGTQTLASFPSNSWRESCHSFRYGNDAVVAAGTYTGRVVYTLSAP